MKVVRAAGVAIDGYPCVGRRNVVARVGVGLVGMMHRRKAISRAAPKSQRHSL